MVNQVLNTDPETVRKIAQARIDMLAGTMTRERWKEIITLLRANRLTAAALPAKRSSKGPIKDADTILGELGI